MAKKVLPIVARLIEDLAELEHQFWVDITKHIEQNGHILNEERLDKWKKLWETDYANLSDEIKEKYRVKARKIFEVLFQKN